VAFVRNKSHKTDFKEETPETINFEETWKQIQLLILATYFRTYQNFSPFPAPELPPGVLGAIA